MNATTQTATDGKRKRKPRDFVGGFVPGATKQRALALAQLRGTSVQKLLRDLIDDAAARFAATK